MSADNGIYVLATVRTRKQLPNSYAWVKSEPHKVYRVAHVGAIDNFDYIKENEPYNLGAYMMQTWGTSKVYFDKSAALENAHKRMDDILRDGGIVEYGVQVIDTEYKFYNDC